MTREQMKARLAAANIIKTDIDVPLGLGVLLADAQQAILNLSDKTIASSTSAFDGFLTGYKHQRAVDMGLITD